MTRHHVVIIGSGFGGLFAAQALRKSKVKITLIAQTNHHLFQPLLYQVATGILSSGEIAPATREVLQKQKNVQVLLGTVDDIDVEAKVVHWQNNGRYQQTSYDTLIVAAGAGQSYFGNDHFATYAPGMKTIDDALELRARIFGAFELAEIEDDPEEIRRLLTFVVVGAGPTGVEMAGQIRELANDTFRGEYRSFDPEDARVILADGVDLPLSQFGEKLGKRTKHSLEKLGVEVRTNTLVTDIDDRTVTMRSKDGTEEVVPCVCKVWAAGVQANPLGKKLTDQVGAKVDRSGRVLVNDNLTLPGREDVFAIGDLMAYKDVPGVAQGAIQSAKFVADLIDARVSGRKPKKTVFEYKDKGSMATIAKYEAVVSIGNLKMDGFTAWSAWLFLHLLYIAGFKNQVATLLRWFIAFVSNNRSARTTTNQQMVARLALKKLGKDASSRLLAGLENVHGELDAKRRKPMRPSERS
ncbi:MAG: NAD(P)/FAD-dependent oxidoreductase [Actinomycetaceae bacterium]|nr:NAD(P)/FAD-dependent oxidoreductase [Actinomycetaceae bacterium]